jgi:hypothetical protein
LLFRTVGVWSSLPTAYLSQDLSIHSWLLEYTAVWEGVICVSKEAKFAALWEVNHEFWDREKTLYVFGNMDSSVTFETISSRLLLD